MADSTRARLTRLHRRWLVTVAHDITEMTSRRSALVFAPHPDDETLGCGATIARKAAAGARVRVVVAADGGDELRRAECREACRRLGVDDHDVTFLGFPDGQLDSHTGELDDQVTAILAQSVADDVFAPCAVDAHTDHRALARAVARPGRDLPATTTVLSYPIWYWNRWAWVEHATPLWRQRAQLAWRPLVHTARNHPRVVSTGRFVALKRDALEAHASQLDPAAVHPGDDVLARAWVAMFLGDNELFFAEQVPRGV